MVIWEVAYSQDKKKLAYVLGRYITCSAGMVQLAIGINIELNPALKQPWNLKRVTCTFWEIKDIQHFATLEESGLELSCLTRCDKYVNHELDYIVPAASKFSCVSQIKGEHVKFISPPSAVYTVSTFYLEYLSGDRWWPLFGRVDFSWRFKWTHSDAYFKQTPSPQTRAPR